MQNMCFFSDHSELISDLFRPRSFFQEIVSCNCTCENVRSLDYIYSCVRISPRDIIFFYRHLSLREILDLSRDPLCTLDLQRFPRDFFINILPYEGDLLSHAVDLSHHQKRFEPPSCFRIRVKKNQDRKSSLSSLRLEAQNIFGQIRDAHIFTTGTRVFDAISFC